MTVRNPPADATAQLAGTAVYCYGVTWASSPGARRVAGVAGASVEAIGFGELAALVSPVESTSIRARRRDLLSHSQVVAEAHEHGTVLPLRFGFVFESADAVVDDFLQPRHDELVALLRRFEGRVEVTVKAYYREEAVLAEIIRDNPRIAQLREATRSRPAAATMPMRLELGERVARELQARTQRDARALLDRLRPLALAVDVDEEPIEHRVLQASFLVEQGRVADFDKAMEELAREHAQSVHFKYLGPLPPHSFVDLAPSGRA